MDRKRSDPQWHSDGLKRRCSSTLPSHRLRGAYSDNETVEVLARWEEVNAPVTGRRCLGRHRMQADRAWLHASLPGQAGLQGRPTSPGP